ncbi:hypothetical protein BIQ83_24270, partial [Escherichia coli]
MEGIAEGRLGKNTISGGVGGDRFVLAEVMAGDDELLTRQAGAIERRAQAPERAAGFGTVKP